jgi:glycosidase
VWPASDKNIICFEKKYGQDQVLIVLNFNKQETSFVNPLTQPIRMIFNSSSTQWLGAGDNTALPVAPGSPIRLNAESALIFEF